MSDVLSAMFTPPAQLNACPVECRFAVPEGGFNWGGAYLIGVKFFGENSEANLTGELAPQAPT
jgi:hypothetical protein